MEVRFLSHKDLPDLPETVLAAGYFDGMHKGHRQLLEEARKLAAKMHVLWGVLTFDPDPWVLFHPDRELMHLYSLQDREQMAQALGADVFYVLRFTRDFAALSPDQFHDVLVQLHCQALVCGFDFQYGKHNAGDIRTLRQAPFPVIVVDPIEDEMGKISSTRIEEAIQTGNMEEAARMLGQWYSIPGTIIKGYQRGSSLLQFPTANLKPADNPVLPAQGVYAGWCQCDSVFYPCMINVGKNPTFSNGTVSIEAHLFDYAGSLYDKAVRFWFGPRIREEKKFSGPAALKAQLEQDELQVRNLLLTLPFPDGFDILKQ